MALNAAEFATAPLARVSTLTPVSWLTFVRWSRYTPASFASLPKATRAFCVLSTAPVTSVPLIFANLIYRSDRSRSCSPLAWNRVLTSPTASPAVSKSVGMDVAISSMMPPISSSASPVAPVFRMIVSMPSSTSVKPL